MKKPKKKLQSTNPNAFASELLFSVTYNFGLEKKVALEFRLPQKKVAADSYLQSCYTLITQFSVKKLNSAF